MKNIIQICATAAAVVLAGCATRNGGFTPDTVGPAPSQTRATDSTNGSLVVYSAFKRNADFNSSDPNRPEHSDYRILAADGSLLRQVHNITKTVIEDAVTIELAPGKYRVVARANGYGLLTIPIIIQAQRSTVLHLEGGGFWPESSALNKTNSVRLPDGEVIGWKAAANE